MTKDQWPKEGDEYWFMGGSGRVYLDTFLEGMDIYKDIKFFGNCFRTKEEAEEAAKKVKALLLTLN
jgi:hypothetical protein